MLHNTDNRVHEDDQKGQRLAVVLQHYDLIANSDLIDVFKIVCPLHEDINASMQINLDRGTFYCYGCGRHGEAVELVKGIEGVNDLKAYIMLERIIGGRAGKPKVVINATQKLPPKELLNQAKLYFYSLPRTNWRYIKNSYMHKRGFGSRELVKVDARLNPNTNYGIAMPMLEMGVFKGYVLRATSESANKDRKYLYNKGFSRRNTLVGDYDSNVVVVVEGYMDWLRFIQHGKTKCVAILGWKVTDQQVEKLKAYTTTLISALDNTASGRKGTQYLRSKGFSVVRFKFPPTAKDPGDLDETDFNKAWHDTMRELKRFNRKGKGVN